MGEVEDRDGFVGMGRRGGVGGVVVTGVCERNCDGMRFHVYLDWMTWIEPNWMGCDTMTRLLAKTAAMALDGWN